MEIVHITAGGSHGGDDFGTDHVFMFSRSGRERSYVENTIGVKVGTVREKTFFVMVFVPSAFPYSNMQNRWRWEHGRLACSRLSWPSAMKHQLFAVSGFAGACAMRIFASRSCFSSMGLGEPHIKIRAALGFGEGDHVADVGDVRGGS